MLHEFAGCSIAPVVILVPRILVCVAEDRASLRPRNVRDKVLVRTANVP